MIKRTEIIVPPSGNKGWSGGAYTVALVYSNKGNFVIKGYIGDFRNNIHTLIGTAKYFVVFLLYPSSDKEGHRSIIKISSKLYVFREYRGRGRKKVREGKYVIDLKKPIRDEHDNLIDRIKLKRLPKAWNNLMEMVFPKL